MTQQNDRNKAENSFKTKVIVGLMLMASIQLVIYFLLHNYR